MDKKSKILLAITIILMITSISFTFYKTVIKSDFEVISDDSSSTDTSVSDNNY